MAETGQKRITLSNFFEQIVEIDKVSQQALKRSNESVSISEKTKLDLEKLIATLKITFDRDLQNVQSGLSQQVTNIFNRNNSRQVTYRLDGAGGQQNQISTLIREDAVEDTELRNAFSSLQSSFSTLESALGILRNDLNFLSIAFLQMQQGRSRMLKTQDAELSKEEDTLQKQQIIGTQAKQQSQQLQDQKRQQEQRENKALSALKGLIGGGLLTGLGGLLGGKPGGDQPGGDITDVTADTPEERALLKTIRGAEGTGGKGGYGKIFGGEVIPELEQGKLTIEEAARMSETGKLPDRLGGRAVPYGKYKGRVSGATGAYQFMPGTMREAARRAGIPLDTPLTPAVQDQLGLSNIRATGVDPTKPATSQTLNQLQGQWTGLGSSQGGMGIDYNTQRYKTILQQEKSKQIQIDKATQTLMNLDKLTKPIDIPGAQPATPQNPLILSPQSYIIPEQRKGVPELTQPMTQDISSITLPAINAGTQQVGGQGRGEAATKSYSVSSASNSMIFANVLTSNFSDKMNIAVG